VAVSEDSVAGSLPLFEHYEVDGWDLKHLHACQIMFDPEKIANQVKQVVLSR